MGLQWQYLGLIEEFRPIAAGGVYIIVHHGCENRALYVGTSNCIGRRVRQHLEGYRMGHRTIWKIGGQDDVYKLMSSYFIHNHIRYFKSLAVEGKIWASTTLAKIDAKNLLLPKQVFTQEWRDFLHDEYLPHIGVWALPINPYDAQKAVFIESAIQKRLVKVFELGRFFNKEDLSVLGKIEFYDQLVRIREPMNNVPELDESSQLVISTLADKHTPDTAFRLAKDQLASVINERLEAQKARNRLREKKLAMYPMHGAKWTPVEQEKMRFLLVEHDLTVEQISEFLQRPPRAIEMQIKKNDRFSNKTWRKDIRMLT